MFHLLIRPDVLIEQRACEKLTVAQIVKKSPRHLQCSQKHVTELYPEPAESGSSHSFKIPCALQVGCDARSLTTGSRVQLRRKGFGGFGRRRHLPGVLPLCHPAQGHKQRNVNYYRLGRTVFFFPSSSIIYDASMRATCPLHPNWCDHPNYVWKWVGTRNHMHLISSIFVLLSLSPYILILSHPSFHPSPGQVFPS